MTMDYKRKLKTYLNIDGLTLTEARGKYRMYIAIKAFKIKKQNKQL